MLVYRVRNGSKINVNVSEKMLVLDANVIFFKFNLPKMTKKTTIWKARLANMLSDNRAGVWLHTGNRLENMSALGGAAVMNEGEWRGPVDGGRRVVLPFPRNYCKLSRQKSVYLWRIFQQLPPHSGISNN